jgi:steroid delta-isomerase-like uncharacterized protein
MSVESNRELGRAFFLAQDRLKGGPDPDLCTPDYSAKIGSYPLFDEAGHRAFAEGFYASFPDLYHSIEDVIAEDDKVAVRFILHGTHEAELSGIPATGRTIAVQGIAMLETVDGKVAHVDATFDQIGLMTQLGVMGG